MNSRRNRLLVVTLALAVLATGCSTPHAPAVPARQPVNFRGLETWPTSVRRVAVLPAHDATGSLPADYLATHDEAWNRALAGSQRAEFVFVSRPTLQKLAGRPTLASAEALPARFLEKVAGQTGAEAVLFLDLVHAKAYPPLVLSVRSRLVAPDTGNTWWMIDELFDAADPGTTRALREEAKSRSQGPGDPVVASLQSPARFADHAFRAIAGVLPPRLSENEPDNTKNATPPAFPAKKHPPRADTITR